MGRVKSVGGGGEKGWGGGVDGSWGGRALRGLGAGNVTHNFFDKLIKQLEKGFDGRGMSHTTFF